MLTITAYTVEWIKDPFGILAGKRYEFVLEIEVDEEDELYSEQGLLLRVIYKVEGESSDILKAEFIERETNAVLDYDLEDEERQLVEAFCKEHYLEAEQD